MLLFRIVQVIGRINRDQPQPLDGLGDVAERRGIAEQGAAIAAILVDVREIRGCDVGHRRRSLFGVAEGFGVEDVVVAGDHVHLDPLCGKLGELARKKQMALLLPVLGEVARDEQKRGGCRLDLLHGCGEDLLPRDEQFPVIDHVLLERRAFHAEVGVIGVRVADHREARLRVLGRGLGEQRRKARVLREPVLHARAGRHQRRGSAENGRAYDSASHHHASPFLFDEMAAQRLAVGVGRTDDELRGDQGVAQLDDRAAHRCLAVELLDPVAEVVEVRQRALQPLRRCG